MSVSEWPGWRRICLRLTATLLWIGSQAAESAPSTNAPKLRPPSSSIEKSVPAKASGSSSRKSMTSGAAAVPKQSAPPSRTTEKKTGERTPVNQDVWPPPPTARQFAPETSIDTSKPPPSLPRASRMRMRACAEEWTRKKLITKSDLPRWREFATGCLNQKIKS